MEEYTLYRLDKPDLQSLLQVLHGMNYQCIGPQVHKGAIVYEELEAIDQLPWGVKDVQAPGQYQLNKTKAKKAFAWSNGPQGIKPFLFKPVETLWKVKRDETGRLAFEAGTEVVKPLALIGLRACDLAALAIQDKVFMQGPHPDPRYQARRSNLLLVAVNCSTSSANCFCVSAGTGPRAQSGYDLVLTELDKGYLLQAGSEKGEAVIQKLSLHKAKTEQQEEARQQSERVIAGQSKQIPFNNTYALRELLFNNLEHPRWAEVAERCLSCGNCTQVCPTCFCHRENEVPALDGQSSEHQRSWDSCFTAEHSYLGGKPLRDTTEKRYRQWLTHKVGSWFDQFDSSGCVGCGRCISWCPVGIDLTEELAAIAATAKEKGNEP